MSLPREHKKSQSAWLDLAVFAGVLSFMAYSLHAFLGNRESSPKTLPESAHADATPTAEPVRRNPASQSSPTSGSTEVLRIHCLHSPTPRSFASGARLMQIHAPFCQGDEKNLAPWRAANETSGEEIMVFMNTKEKTLSTNYFSLKDGANELVFTQDLGKGHQRVEKLRINRSSAD